MYFKTQRFIILLSGLMSSLMNVAYAEALMPPAEQQIKVNDYNSYLYPQMNLPAQSDWYEWWYTKVIDPQTGRGFYFTYGIVNPTGSKTAQGISRVNVSFGDFKNNQQIEKVLPVQSFRGSTERYEVQVFYPDAKNSVFASASKDYITAQFEHEGKPVYWNLKFKESWGYNVMGWAMWIPKLLNIYWYPVQGSVKVSGEIFTGDERIVLQDAPAYQDRNWGESFPKWWTWITSNYFEGEDPASGTVLVAGGGVPKVLGHKSPYEGVSFGLRYQGKTYAFRPVDGSLPKTEIRFGKWEVQAKNIFGDEIKISASAPKELFMDLKFLAPNGQYFHDYETLNGHLLIHLKPAGRTTWVVLKSKYAGIEYGSYDLVDGSSFK